MIFVAEIGINHNGDMEIAKQIIRSVDADIVKFQLFDPSSIKDRTAPHPVPSNSFGATYYEHKKFLNFNFEQLCELREECTNHDKQYAVSVFDVPSLIVAASTDPAYIKIPSARCLNKKLFNAIKKNWDGDIHLSTGMTDSDERLEAIEMYNKLRNRVYVYACNSDYSENAIIEIPNIIANNDWITYTGLSVHRPEPDIGIMAYATGYEILEFHVTLDRAMKGTDHKISLTIDEFNDMVKRIKHLETFTALDRSEEILDGERVYRNKLWLQ